MIVLKPELQAEKVMLCVWWKYCQLFWEILSLKQRYIDLSKCLYDNLKPYNANEIESRDRIVIILENWQGETNSNPGCS